jgi:thiol-disulfide isomerase/thioredoxin
MRALGVVLVLLILSLAGLLAGLSWSGAGGHDPRAVAAASDASVGEFTPLDPPRPAPALGFKSRAGEALHLADFQGQVLLVNLWATWCGPCVREMPSLERLQADLGDRLKVLAISEDRGGAHVVEPFITEHALKRLAVYLDQPGAADSAFHLRGLPTTFLIDANGRIRAVLEGAAEWDSPKIRALVERYLAAEDATGGVIKTAAPR